MGASEVSVEEEGAEPEDDEKRKKQKKRRGIVRKVVNNVKCCSTPHHRTREPPDPPYEPRIAMGPLTLSQFIDTLEPYDPSLHGWRGQEPRVGWRGLGSPKIHPRTGQFVSNKSDLV